MTNHIFAYCIAFAAAKTGVLIHAICVMSNHWHAVVSDPYGNMPDFLQRVHGMVAHCLNAHLGREENLWDNRQTSLVDLVGNEDVISKMLYTLHNPVSANLVDKSQHWPGLRLMPGDVQTVKKPPVYFRKKGPMPDKLELTVTAPLNLPLGPLRTELCQALRTAEGESRDMRSRHSISMVGKRAILRQSPFESPRTLEAPRTLNPRVASFDKWARIETLRRLKSFVDAYKEALAQWRAGKRNVVFPAGTYKMRRLHGVVCA